MCTREQIRNFPFDKNLGVSNQDELRQAIHEAFELTGGRCFHCGKYPTFGNGLEIHLTHNTTYTPDSDLHYIFEFPVWAVCQNCHKNLHTDMDGFFVTTDWERWVRAYELV